MNSHATLTQLIAARLAAAPERTALLAKREGTFQPVAWKTLADSVYRLTAALRNLGIQPGDRVATYSPNRYEWIIVDLAIVCSGAVHVPIHSTLTGPQVAFQLKHSEAKLLFAADASSLANVGKLLPAGVTTVLLEGTSANSHGLNDLLARHDAQAGAQVAAESARAALPADLVTIMYSSGTTGEPRGVMLTQENLAFNAAGAADAFHAAAHDVRLTFLPWSHIYARTCDLYCWMASDGKLVIAESRETVIADCQATWPTFLNGVPYFYSKVMKHLLATGQADQPDALLNLLGGRVESCCAGGAKLPTEVFDFFQSHGINLFEGYGLTESSPVISLSTKTSFRRGSVGQALPGTEVRIADDGEVLARGPHIMAGYWHDPAATAAAIQDGWLHTGDLGRLDDEGFLYITGRKKELIVLRTGKKAAPTLIESLLMTDPLIIQAVVIGDGRDYLTALIVPDPDRLKEEIHNQGLWVFTTAQALAHPTILALYEEHIRQRLADLAHHEQIGRFTLMDRGFTIESGELTPKLSYRRAEIHRNCADLIEAMYAKQ